MTFPTGAQRASSSSSRGGKKAFRLASALRVLLSLAICGLAPVVLSASPAQASCGTQWDSRRIPPDTIRVYRTARHRVDVVDFKRYVQVVMASEWPGYLPRAAREAGATAVKQYAWYHALRGNHRSWYVTRDGVCYDVVDTTTDQLYRPEDVEVGDNVRGSVDKTWGLSIRKNGRFFMTGYRTGNDVRCGRDADGWKLFARSVVHCARRGHDRGDIQRIYYGRHVSFVWNDRDQPPGDGVAPDVTEPQVSIRQGQMLGDGIGRVTWSGSDESGIARYVLERKVDGGAWKEVTLTDPSATKTSVALTDGHTYQFRVRARDTTGVWSKNSTSEPVDVRVAQTDRADFGGGRWRMDEDSQASGVWTRYTRTPGAFATLTFRGRGIAYVAPEAPGHGRVQILVDGLEVAIIDLDAATFRPRRIVFAAEWPRAITRTLEIVVLDDDRVDVDAFVILR